MARVFSIFLMILVMNQQGISLTIPEIGFGTIKQAFDYMNVVYQKGTKYTNRMLIQQDNPAKQLKNSMTQLRTISEWLINFEVNQGGRIDIFEELLNEIESISDFELVRSELIENVNNVDSMFEEGIKLMENGDYNIKTLKEFAHSVLDGRNLDFALFKIHKLIFPGINIFIENGLITLAYEHTQAHYKRLCNKEHSPQQQMYYIFMLLIRTQLRAFTISTQVYSIESIINNSSYSFDYKYLKRKYQQQLQNYVTTFIRDLNIFSADIHRCDVENPIIGKNVYEMEGLFQVLVNYESKIKRSVYFQMTPFCGGCEEIFNTAPLKYRVHNCKSYTSISGCPTSELSSYASTVQYSWFTADSETFGHQGQCNHTLYEMNRYFGAYFCMNDICVCSVDVTDVNVFPESNWGIHINEPKIMKISVEPQYSDIANNKIVVGVKFILHDNAIHLQIQQSKFSKRISLNEKAVWKPVDIDNNNKTIHINYDKMFHKRSRLYLDDVMVYPGFVVTGVKLQLSKNHDGFELHVHSTKYNSETGLLSGPQKWFEPGEYSPDNKDYQRRRTEIKMNEPDNPTMTHNYHPDPQTNKFIQFQHTSIKKDAGFHTVPFFDGQPVESPRFPLGGIGLFYRQQDGFGGYIAPRLFTYNISWDMESSLNYWQKIKEAYKKCGLKVPSNVTAFNEDATCETLKQIGNNKIDTKNVGKSKFLSKYYYSTINTMKTLTENDDVEVMISTIH